MRLNFSLKQNFLSQWKTRFCQVYNMAFSGLREMLWYDLWNCNGHILGKGLQMFLEALPKCS